MIFLNAYGQERYEMNTNSISKQNGDNGINPLAMVGTLFGGNLEGIVLTFIDVDGEPQVIMPLPHFQLVSRIITLRASAKQMSQICSDCQKSHRAWNNLLIGGQISGANELGQEFCMVVEALKAELQETLDELETGAAGDLVDTHNDSVSSLISEIEDVLDIIDRDWLAGQLLANGRNLKTNFMQANITELKNRLLAEQSMRETQISMLQTSVLAARDQKNRLLKMVPDHLKAVQVPPHISLPISQLGLAMKAAPVMKELGLKPEDLATVLGKATMFDALVEELGAGNQLIEVIQQLLDHSNELGDIYSLITDSKNPDKSACDVIEAGQSQLAELGLTPETLVETVKQLQADSAELGEIQQLLIDPDNPTDKSTSEIVANKLRQLKASLTRIRNLQASRCKCRRK